ncbi:MAG: hypothetical protein ACRBN8_22415 [Nannocystales bacterium]
MAREGNHSATLTVKGNARSANREVQALAQRTDKFERSVERSNVALDKQAAKLARASKAGQGMGAQVKSLSNAIAGPAGMVFAITGATAAYGAWNSRIIDSVNVTTDLRFSMEEITAAMDNMTTQHEAAAGAALLQSTSLKLTQDQMNKLSGLTATVADKNKKDLVTSWDAVSKAIAKGNVDRLRAIGLNTDNAKLLDEVARATGRSTTQIGLAERQQIAYNEVLRAMGEQAEIAGKGQDGMAFSFERAKNKAIDAFDALGRGLNSVPIQLREFRIEVERSMVDVLADADTSSKDAAERVDELGDATSGLGRQMVAMATLGNSELIPFLMDWETHSRTISGLMGNMPTINMRGGVGGIGGALQLGLDKARMGSAPPGALSKAWRTVADGAKDAGAALVELAKEAEKNARESHSRGGRGRKPAQALGRGFDGPTSVDSSEQQRHVDGIQDAEIEREIGRERRRAEVVAMRENNNRALLEADERARLRQAEIAVERAQRDQDEAALIVAKDQRDQAMHDRNLRRMEEDLRAREHAKETNRRWLQEQINDEEEVERKRLANLKSSTQVAQGANTIALNSSEIAKLAANETIKGEKRKAQFMQRAAGVQSLTIGALETVKAAAAFASFNYVQGAMHTSAAALAFARGGMLMSGNVGSLGGGGSAGGSSGGRSSQGSSRGRSGPSSDVSVPVSQQSQNTAIGDPISKDRRDPNAGGGNTFVTELHARMVTPDTVEMVTRMQRDQARGRGIRVA